MLIIVCCYVGIVRAAVRCVKSLKKVTWHQSLANAVVEEQERDRRQQELMSYEYRLAKVLCCCCCYC
jgi:hypothetical protein